MEDTVGVGTPADGSGQDAGIAEAGPSCLPSAADSRTQGLPAHVDLLEHGAHDKEDLEVVNAAVCLLSMKYGQEDPEVMNAVNTLLSMKHNVQDPHDCNGDRTSPKKSGFRVNAPTSRVLCQSHGAVSEYYPSGNNKSLGNLHNNPNEADFDEDATMSGDGAGSSDSDETIDDLPANNKGALSDNTLEEASQLSADPGAQGTRQSPRKMAPIDKKAEKKQLTYSEQCELNRERDASARAREGAHFDALLKKRYEEYMQRSRSNLARAVKLYCEREERKARQPWPQLERGKKSLEAMKRVGLDPELAQEMEARKKGAAEMAKSGPVKQKSVKSAPAKRCKGASTKLPVDPEKGAPPMRQTRYKLRHQASQASSVSNNELREAPTTTAPGSNLESAASDEQPESSTSQSADPDPLRIPGKRKRRTNAENLASDLGEKWMLDASESRRLRPRRT